MGFKQMKVCGLYTRTSQKGGEFYSGRIPQDAIVTDRSGNHFLPLDSNDIWINIFHNTRKSSDKHPDFELVLSWRDNEDKQGE